VSDCLYHGDAVDVADGWAHRVDDVEDSSVLRRGIPVAHSIFGTAQTINSANYMYFIALQEIQKLNNPGAIDIYVQELLNLHRGQGMDLFWRDTLTCPTEEEYLEMVGNKTGGLFRLAVKLMQAESDTNKYALGLQKMEFPD
jgi:geranylgeranyl diphosphate synthase type 3